MEKKIFMVVVTLLMLVSCGKNSVPHSFWGAEFGMNKEKVQESLAANGLVLKDYSAVTGETEGLEKEGQNCVVVENVEYDELMFNSVRLLFDEDDMFYRIVFVGATPNDVFGVMERYKKQYGDWIKKEENNSNIGTLYMVCNDGEYTGKFEGKFGTKLFSNDRFAVFDMMYFDNELQRKVNGDE